MNYPLANAFWTILWFFLWIMWLFLLFRIIVDLFRNHETSGWSKALWLVALILLPFIGVLIYVIVHGGEMAQRDVAQAQRQEQAAQDYIRQTAASGSSVEELRKLAELRNSGAITEEEYARAKEKILA